ncbi:chondroitinase family polysaccharide lyase [Pseudocolwellia agarivorans]|uniref:chondroitinase family polysaccharide lyase n=1 Tax=Pseudocolwellia agarivorans TaxID=1911682 RepID=UPI000985F4E3|nr:chondroitinase family polysaccharide lyase [Pseudocolwellia agarivorans]
MKSNYKTLFNTLITAAFFLITPISIAETKYGNYLDSRIGDVNNQTFDALLYYPDKEWLYDFDTPTPFTGIAIDSGSIESSSDYYMSAPQSMRWNTSQGASLTLNVNINLKKSWPTHYYLTAGVFQADIPTGKNKRAFKIELLSANNSVIASRNIYMHRGGWNILCSNLKFSSNQTVDKIKITQIQGTSGAVLLDNVMISAFQNSNDVFMSNGTVEVENPELTMDKAKNYPATTLTKAQKKAFLTIAEKVIPFPKKVSKISIPKLKEYIALHAFYNIKTKGDYASGVNPLYYWRSVTKKESDPFIHYTQNQLLCKKMKEIGKAWYQTRDKKQKAVLARIITDFVRLAVTFGDMPNPWYNGRGFADGVYYAKDLLEEAGLLDRITTLIMQQYGVDQVLFNEQRWDNPLALKGKHGPEFFWQGTADHLNTTSKSMILSILTAADTSEKARNLTRFKSWMDNIVLSYSPSVEGTLKPDGSWYHHWGNRYDNYGWVAGWRGATELVWWMSHTPFAVDKTTKARMNHMADIHFAVMDKQGHNGPQDKMHKVPSDGFMNLAMAGSPDGLEEIDPIPASYWLAYPQEPSYSKNKKWVKQIKAKGIKPAAIKDTTLTLSYESAIYHRTGDWQVFTRGISKKHYHTQYQRNGYLFYNIGGLSLVKEGEASGMQRYYGAPLLQRHGDDLDNITAGYNFSRAPGVTSVISNYNDLKQLYYQRGTSDFVGGTSMTNDIAVFIQEFDANKNDKYASTVASGLRFKKSYFIFGNDIVLLASGISNNGSNTDVETGLLQEATKTDKNEFTFANNLTTTATSYNENYSSSDVPWMFNNSLNIGVYLLPDQNFTLFKGSQTFGPLTGNIISTYLTHSEQEKGWYEYILRVNTNQSGMQQLAVSMKEDEPEYKVLQRDENAHIVRSKQYSSTAYAIFNSSNLELPQGILKSIDKPAVLIVNKKKHDVSLSVSYPDKRIDETDTNPLGWSLATDITIVLEGELSLINSQQKNVSVVADSINKTTTVITTVKDGLPLNINLKNM